MQMPTPEALARVEFTDSDLDRFLAKIDPTGPCWRWTAATNGAGYGQFHKAGSDGRRQRYAHRLAYELWVGPIPEGMTVDHTCENGSGGCVTPSHLRAMAMVDNVKIGSRNVLMAKARQTHCIHGHPLAGDNLIIIKAADGRNRRRCRTCRDAANARRDPEMLRAYAREYYRRTQGSSHGKPTADLPGPAEAEVG